MPVDSDRCIDMTGLKLLILVNLTYSETCIPIGTQVSECLFLAYILS